MAVALALTTSLFAQAGPTIPGSGSGTSVPPPPSTSPRAPKPDLGLGVPAPGVLLGLSPDEIQRVLTAAPGSPLEKMRTLAANRARLGDPTLTIVPGRHLIDRRFNKAVPKNQALNLGFLADWNQLVDALGLAYAVTGNVAYAMRVDDHLRPWANYRPPMGVGGAAGGEPSIYHREFVGAFRAAEHCWLALSPAGRAAAVHLAKTIETRSDDWWSLTPWIRGNHAAASAQTGLCAAILLVRAAQTDPALISPADADARLLRFTSAGRALPQQTLVGGPLRAPGLLGFTAAVEIGLLSEANRAIWQGRGLPAGIPLGATLDLVDHASDERMAYHGLTTHHLLTSYWALVRSGITFGSTGVEAQQRASIGALLECSRPYLEGGQHLPGTTDKVPNPVTDPRTREVIALAARLFPEKAWLTALAARGTPTSYAELYAEVAVFN